MPMKKAQQCKQKYSPCCQTAVAYYRVSAPIYELFDHKNWKNTRVLAFLQTTQLH